MPVDSVLVQPTYCGLPPAPQELAAAWNTDWRLLLALALFAAAARYTARRGVFAAGWLALVVAFVSPLCALTVALFAARAVHHLLLVTVAAPLLGAAFVHWGRRVPSGVMLLAVAVVLALWHVPAVYSRIWHSEVWYWGMQVALLLPATMFWACIWRALGWSSSAQKEPPLASGSVMAVLAHIAALAGVMGLIGAVLTFAPQVLYPEHGLSGLAYGLQPLQDQQLAGLLMWVPGFAPLAAIAGLALHRAWQQAKGPVEGAAERTNEVAAS